MPSSVSFAVFISAVLGTKARGTEVTLDPKGEGCAAKRSCPDLTAPPTYPRNDAPFHLSSSKAGLVPVISQPAGWVATETWASSCTSFRSPEQPGAADLLWDLFGCS